MARHNNEGSLERIGKSVGMWEIVEDSKRWGFGFGRYAGEEDCPSDVDAGMTGMAGMSGGRCWAMIDQSLAYLGDSQG